MALGLGLSNQQPINDNEFADTESEALQPRYGGGNSGGMDPWQTGVERQLGELRSDLRGLALDVGTIKTDVATLKERVAHLPGKGFIVGVVLSAMAVFGAIASLGPLLLKAMGAP